MKKPIMSDELFYKSFDECFDKIMESKYEPDKILCCISDLKHKVLLEMDDNRIELNKLQKQIKEVLLCNTPEK